MQPQQAFVMPGGPDLREDAEFVLAAQLAGLSVDVGGIGPYGSAAGLPQGGGAQSGPTLAVDEATGALFYVMPARPARSHLNLAGLQAQGLQGPAPMSAPAALNPMVALQQPGLQLMGPQSASFMQPAYMLNEQPMPQPVKAQRRDLKGYENQIKRTVYVSNVALHVTEEHLAAAFADAGQVQDCRICGDTSTGSAIPYNTRFAFVEFSDNESAKQALNKTGMLLGGLPVKVQPSRTAILPINKELMPRSQQEVERTARTVYVTNIDKAAHRADVRHFFEQLCGPVSKLRLLDDHSHSSRIAFIEFSQAESAVAALHCTGAMLGSMPLRVVPSKTPVRTDASSRSHNSPRSSILLPPNLHAGTRLGVTSADGPESGPGLGVAAGAGGSAGGAPASISPPNSAGTSSIAPGPSSAASTVLSVLSSRASHASPGSAPASSSSHLPAGFSELNHPSAGGQLAL